MTGDGTTPALSPVLIRRLIIEQSKRAHVGHIGSALSIVDILVALFSGIVDPERDTFILSKGHAALAQYCVLAELGVISRQMLDTYCGNDSQLGVHPDHTLARHHFLHRLARPWPIARCRRRAGEAHRRQARKGVRADE